MLAPVGHVLSLKVLLAGLAAVALAALWLGERYRVPSGDTSRVPAAYAVTARRASRLPATTQNRLIGPVLLAIAGACLVYIAVTAGW